MITSTLKYLYRMMSQFRHLRCPVVGILDVPVWASDLTLIGLILYLVHTMSTIPDTDCRTLRIHTECEDAKILSYQERTGPIRDEKPVAVSAEEVAAPSHVDIVFHGIVAAILRSLFNSIFKPR